MQCLIQELGADVNKAAKSGITPLYVAAMMGNLNVVRFLASQLGTDVNLASKIGDTPLFVAAQEGHIDIMRCLVVEFFADVNKSTHEGCTPLLIAVQEGQLDAVRCLVKDLGADVRQATHDGRTPLTMASNQKHTKASKLLIKYGADAQASSMFGTAADVSKNAGAPASQMEYLNAKAHCSNLDCSGAGHKKCTGCKQARYCGQSCQLAHWKAHKAECKKCKEA
jgi:ankyrin repeat protein